MTIVKLNVEPEEMLSMTRRGLWSVFMVASLSVVGCGDDGKKVADAPPDDQRDAGNAGGDSGSDNGDDNGSDNTGKDNGGTSGSTGGRIAINDAPKCADDKAGTPGSECDDAVNCGGDLVSPHACPLATHSCCVSGPPQESTVNCYEGTAACEGVESVTPCDGSEDCPNGNVCCVTPPGAVVITECRVFEDCDEPSEGTIFCHSDDDCPGGKACTQPKDATWWGFCN